MMKLLKNSVIPRQELRFLEKRWAFHHLSLIHIYADDGGRVGQLGQRVDAVGYQRQSGRRLVFRDDFAAELAGQAKRLDGRGVELRRGVFFVQALNRSAKSKPPHDVVDESRRNPAGRTSLNRRATQAPPNPCLLYTSFAAPGGYLVSFNAGSVLRPVEVFSFKFFARHLFKDQDVYKRQENKAVGMLMNSIIKKASVGGCS